MPSLFDVKQAIHDDAYSKGVDAGANWAKERIEGLEQQLKNHEDDLKRDTEQQEHLDRLREDPDYLQERGLTPMFPSNPRRVT
ncbi:MAG: hypothetical protein V3W52_17115 [Syntrophobacteria bacterium]